MTSPDAARREHWLMTEFNSKVAALRSATSCAANWLEDFRDSLAKIFGLEPSEAWENMMFTSGVYLMLETVKKMEGELLLPAIDRYSYRQAKQEWDEPDARAMIQRELNFAINIRRLRGILEFFSTTLDGLPIENEGARSHCFNELARLLRMRRLAR